jgi:hypothetical protein
VTLIYVVMRRTIQLYWLHDKNTVLIMKYVSYIVRFFLNPGHMFSQFFTKPFEVLCWSLSSVHKITFWPSVGSSPTVLKIKNKVFKIGLVIVICSY